jgi:peptidoglycan/LPS O-acetylase OafA/YrhL
VPAPLLLFAAAGATEFRAAPGTDFVLPPVPEILGNALLQNFNNRLSATCFVAACVLIALSTGVRLPTPAARVLEYLGDLSYPLYLFHFPAAAAAYVFLEWRSAIALTSAGLLAAMAFHHGLVQPVKWLVRRRQDRPRSAAEPPAGPAAGGFIVDRCVSPE